jgi:uncharacterized membrane protein
MNKIALPKIKLPKLKKNAEKAEKKIAEAADISKINVRKFNWLTVAAILSYLNVLVFIPLFFCRKSEFAQFHAKQGIILLIVWVLFYFSFYFPVVPYVFALIILIYTLIGVINVITGKRRKLPFIGKFAK